MIEINNLTTVSIDTEFLKKIGREVFKKEKISGEVGLSIAFIGPGRMREINKRYRGKSRVTDVLSFSEKKVLGEKFKKIYNLGEIVICPQEVKKNAKRYATNFEKELARVFIHGILSLLGYEHEKSAAGAKKMEEKEQYYLSKFLISNF